MVGDFGTGKTSIIKRYVQDLFINPDTTTIGVECALKVINWDDNTVIKTILWDIAGERFGYVTHVYYKDAVETMVRYDITKQSTLDKAIQWKQDIEEKVKINNGKDNIPVILLGNKNDLIDTSMVDTSTEKNMNDFVQNINLMTCFIYQRRRTQT